MLSLRPSHAESKPRPCQDTVWRQHSLILPLHRIHPPSKWEVPRALTLKMSAASSQTWIRGFEISVRKCQIASCNQTHFRVPQLSHRPCPETAPWVNLPANFHPSRIMLSSRCSRSSTSTCVRSYLSLSIPLLLLRTTLVTLRSIRQ